MTLFRFQFYLTIHNQSSRTSPFSMASDPLVERTPGHEIVKVSFFSAYYPWKFFGIHLQELFLLPGILPFVISPEANLFFKIS